MDALSFCRIAGAWALVLAAMAAAAQGGPPTAEQIGKDPNALRQEAEQKRAQQQQQREQQQQSQQQADQQWNDAVRNQQSRANADMANAEAVRRTWAQRPPLPAEKNPLLGRWESLGAGPRKGSAPGLSPEMAALANSLLGGITGGMCDSMLGRGTIEFRPAGLTAIGRDGREHAMYRAEYRGGGSRVVVLPQGGTNFTHMIIDFDGPDRATVAAVGCGLVRAGAGPTKAALATSATGAADSAATLQWTLLGHVPAKGGIDIYVAPASVRRTGDNARMLDLFDFKTRQAFAGKPYLSARNEYEFDCARGRQRMLKSTGFSDHMGQGTVVVSDAASGPWEAVGTSGAAFEHWQVACKRR